MFPREQIVFMNRHGMCFVSAVLGMFYKLLIHILLRLQLVGECELCGLLLQLGELVLVLGDLLEGGLDELALHVTHGDGELVDLEITEDDLALQEEHLGLQLVPFVEVLLADLLQIVHRGILNVSLGSTTLSNDTESLLGFALLLLLQLLGGLLAEKSTELLLALGGHKSLLLGHDESVLGACVTTSSCSHSRERSPH